MSDLHDETPTQQPAEVRPESAENDAAEADVSTESATATEPVPAETASAEPDSAAPVVAAEAAGKEEVEAKADEAKADEAEVEAKADDAEADKAKVEAKADEAKADEAKADEPEAKADEAKADEAQAAVSALPEAEAAKDGATSSETDEAMAELERALAEKTLVKGQVIGWNKGGYHVAVGKIAAFCPVSQIEIGSPRGPKRYLDKKFLFRVIEIQNGGRRVVLSRAEAIKTEREQKAALVRELLEPGAEIEGKVSSLTTFGAFVDLGGGIEGLVHVSEISRRRVEHPKEVLRSGQKVKVSVLKIEKGGQRISLSMKRLEPDPWKGVADRFPPGSEFTGKIVRQTDFGLFVEVEPGLEGLVHTSRLGLGMTLESEAYAVGQEVSGWVYEVESRRRRLSLSLRKVAGGNPWRGVTDRYPIGEVVKGRVEKVANFGVFIELEPGLTGLLPFSVLGSGGPSANPRRQFHAGKEVPVRVLSIDRNKKRISLGTESSKAEGNQQDYREYMKGQRQSSGGGGMSVMAAAFAKLKEQQQQV